MCLELWSVGLCGPLTTKTQDGGAGRLGGARSPIGGQGSDQTRAVPVLLAPP